MKYNNLNKVILFKNLSQSEIDNLIASVRVDVRTYDKQESIFHERDTCSEISLILEGEIAIQSIFPSGNIFTLAKFGANNIFGEALIFSNQSIYPVDITAIKNDTRIMHISKKALRQLFALNDQVAINFINLLSEKIIMLNNKTKILALNSIRKKIAYYLLDAYKKTNQSTIKLKMSKKMLAEQLAIPRPSLSRELIKLKKENVITYNKNTINLLDIEVLESYLFE